MNALYPKRKDTEENVFSNTRKPSEGHKELHGQGVRWEMVSVYRDVSARVLANGDPASKQDPLGVNRRPLLYRVGGKLPLPVETDKDDRQPTL